MELGGLTKEEAEAELVGSGVLEIKVHTVTVKFRGADSQKIDSSKNGSLPAENAVEVAYSYGRSGSFFSGSFTYINSLLSGHDAKEENGPYIDTDYVKSQCQKTAKAVNTELLKGTVDIGEKSIEIVKGGVGPTIDESKLYDQAINELKINDTDKSSIDYDGGTFKPEEVDIQKIYDSVYTEPVNSVYDRDTQSATAHVVGVSFDIEAAKEKLDKAKDGERVEIPLVITEPEITQEKLQSVLFADCLYTKTTSLTSNSNRNTNVGLAAAAIDSYVLNPGEEFSFNQVVGERTTAKGYKSAAAYRNGEVVQETGGGICQVSSTLYYCALNSNLKIVERTNHRYVASYLPLGMDATVSWGGPDFRFVNDTDYPIKISAYRDGYNVTVALYGTKTSDEKVEMTYTYIKSVDPPLEEKEDPTLLKGTTVVESEGSSGCVVDTYRNIYDENGNLIQSIYEDRSTYSGHARVVLIGTKEPEPEPEPEPTPEPENPNVAAG